LLVLQADPYISIKIGKTELDNRDEYIANSIEPHFGKSVKCFLIIFINTIYELRTQYYRSNKRNESFVFSLLLRLLVETFTRAVAQSKSLATRH